MTAEQAVAEIMELLRQLGAGNISVGEYVSESRRIVEILWSRK